MPLRRLPVPAGGGAAAEEEEPPPAAVVQQCRRALQGEFDALDALAARNLARVQAALAAAAVGPHHLHGSTGYGHGDEGRRALDAVFAELMGAEAACVRGHFVSGTHAIACGLFGALRPGDELLAVAGPPYDTLEEVIGLSGAGAGGEGAAAGAAGVGSLRDFGVAYREAPLAPTGRVDLAALEAALGPRTRVALVQRSCGYALRPPVTLADIAAVVEVVRCAAPGCRVLVDNCYGEFVEEAEPCAAGADLVMGSLIKSPGGTLAPCGGYVAGDAALVAAAQARLTAPGVGMDAGAHGGDLNRLLFQGLYLAPLSVAEALKGGLLAAAVMAAEGYPASPSPAEFAAGLRSYIAAIELGSAARLAAFCGAVQAKSPVGSYIRPVPGATAGYGDEVIFAAGTFVDGSTGELSADGPLRPPFAVFCQGGNHWVQWALALEAAVVAVRAVEDGAPEGGGA